MKTCHNVLKSQYREITFRNENHFEVLIRSEVVARELSTRIFLPRVSITLRNTINKQKKAIQTNKKTTTTHVSGKKRGL